MRNATDARTESRRLLEHGFKIASLAVGQYPIPQTAYANYPLISAHANLAVTWSGMLVATVDLGWSANHDDLRRVEEMLAGSGAPVVTAESVFKAWWFAHRDAFHAPRSGQLYGYTASIIAADAYGVLAPGSRVPGRLGGLVSVEWEDPENITPVAPPAALLDELKRSCLLDPRAGGGWSVAPVNGSAASGGA